MNRDEKLAVAVIVILLVLFGLGVFSVIGSYPTFTQEVSNSAVGTPTTITWSIGPDTYGGLNGAGGEIDVYYNLQSVKIDGQQVLLYQNCGTNCWQYNTALGVTLTTTTSNPGYYHASGYLMCDAVHQNVAGQKFAVPKETIYTLTITGLQAGTHTVTTQIAGNQQISYKPDGTMCSGTNGGKTLTDTFIVTSQTPPPPPPNPIDQFWALLSSYVNSVINWLRSHGFPFSIASASVPVNVPYATNITLSNIPAPNTNYAGGSVSWIDCATFVINSNGNYLYKGTVARNVSTPTFTGAISFTPTTAGTFAQGAVCTMQNATYNYANSSWSPWSAPVVVADDKGTLTVTGPNNPPSPNGDFWAGIASWWNQTVCWLKIFLHLSTTC